METQKGRLQSSSVDKEKIRPRTTSSSWYHNLYEFPSINPRKDKEWKPHDHLIALAVFAKGYV